MGVDAGKKIEKHKLIPYRLLSKQLFLLLGQNGIGFVEEEKSHGDKELNYIPPPADPCRQIQSDHNPETPQSHGENVPNEAAAGA